MAGSFGQWATVLTVALVACSTTVAAEPDGASGDAKIDRLQKQMVQMAKELELLKAQRVDDARKQEERWQAVEAMKRDADPADPPAGGWFSKFRLGGYGEMHGNFGEGGTKDKFDIHRLVVYVGYDFADWVKLHSEIEIEHAFVTDGAGGELVIEQLYLDFLLAPAFNVRVGRILTPLGIINKTHEPTLFSGVERPSFAKFIIPTTWSSDGVGVFGAPLPWLQYELYVVGGLDGSQFSASNGIRDGRIKERPSLHSPAVTGRVDFFPLVGSNAGDQELRLGLSTYVGGLKNSNGGGRDGADGCLRIYSADIEYSIDRWDFRGAIAYQQIDGAKRIGNGTAKGIFGWYVEAGYHFLPESVKVGKLKDADAVVFARFDAFDTQHRMPSGVRADPSFRRTEATIGVNFFPVPNVVLKADYQFRWNAGGEDLDNLLNLGVGWNF